MCSHLVWCVVWSGLEESVVSYSNNMIAPTPTLQLPTPFCFMAWNDKTKPDVPHRVMVADLCSVHVIIPPRFPQSFGWFMFYFIVQPISKVLVNEWVIPAELNRSENVMMMEEDGRMTIEIGTVLYILC